VLNATISRYVYGTLVPEVRRSDPVFRSSITGRSILDARRTLRFDGQLDLVKGVLSVRTRQVRTEGFDLYVMRMRRQGQGWVAPPRLL